MTPLVQAKMQSMLQKKEHKAKVIAQKGMSDVTVSNPEFSVEVVYLETLQYLL